jgi:hypothetical protein
MKERFSKRLGLLSQTAEITIRYDAPEEFRQYLFFLMQNYSHGLKRIREIVCIATKQAPNSNQWEENDFMKTEIEEKIVSCFWPYVYDLIEMFYDKLNASEKDDFSDSINEYFLIHGIGWKLSKGFIEYRGDDFFENDLKLAQTALKERHLDDSKKEIVEAIKDMSRKPDPDATGAIQHSIAALECVCRKISRDEKDTLGDVIKKHPNLVPSPLNEAISKIWGFSSEQGRHLREGRSPKIDEAELLVHLSASICLYLSKK